MELSIVIPAHNEQGNIEKLCQEILSVFEDKVAFEVIIVNDGSTDRTFETCEEISSRHHQIKILSLGRRFGQTAAMTAGIDLALGEIIVLMDADLQNDPHDIPTLLSEIKKGFDVVVGWRKSRKDSFLTKTLPSKMANNFVKYFTGISVNDLGCTLKAFRRDYISNIRLYGEMHRFIPLYALALGGRIQEVVVNHRPRTSGKTKYNIFKTTNFLLDLLTTKFLLNYMTKPMHFFGRISILSLLIGIVLFGGIVAHRFMYGIPISENALLSVVAVLFVVSVNFLLMGFFSEMQIRTYYESQNKNIYFVAKKINFKTDSERTRCL